jgi:hypothetical protein
MHSGPLKKRYTFGLSNHQKSCQLHDRYMAKGKADRWTGGAGTLPLLDLPESILSAIAKHVSAQHVRGHPMLAAARATRNAVLRSLSKIKA